MAFLETPRFPDDIAFGAIAGPSYSTNVVVVSSGVESRNRNWTQQRNEYDVSAGVRTKAHMDSIIAHFHVVGGSADGFRFKDWTDYQDGGGGIVTLISGDDYQMYKRYTRGSSTKDRKITKPITSEISISGGGTYSIDYATGIITRVSGAVPTGWTGTFDVPVRFVEDKMKIEITNRSGNDLLLAWNSILVIEIK